MTAGERAVFLDRDGTLIHDVHYISRPELVRLIEGAADALRDLRELGWRIVVATNQSGIARGLITPDEYERVRARFEELLAAHGASVDATYHCPHHPDVTGDCGCRKPGTEMFERAAADLSLDLAASVYVGDRWRDVAPARQLGGRGILVPSPNTPEEDIAQAMREAEVRPTLADVVRHIGS